jgi:hypothetical protein
MKGCAASDERRWQETAGVRKLVTRRLYYAVDNEAEEIIVLSVQHPAQDREHSDA